jgi:ABC-type uncharacterized transport system ATPase subunit
MGRDDRRGRRLFETLCNIPAKTRKWVWTGVIPEGQLTLLIGEPGVGKSIFAMDVIAWSTRGQCGLSGLEPCEPGQPPFSRHVGQIGQIRTHKNAMIYGSWPMTVKLANFFELNL